jgi:hypothetical protein
MEYKRRRKTLASTVQFYEKEKFWDLKQEVLYHTLWTVLKYATLNVFSDRLHAYACRISGL